MAYSFEFNIVKFTNGPFWTDKTYGVNLNRDLDLVRWLPTQLLQSLCLIFLFTTVPLWCVYLTEEQGAVVFKLNSCFHFVSTSFPPPWNVSLFPCSMAKNARSQKVRIDLFLPELKTIDILSDLLSSAVPWPICSVSSLSNAQGTHTFVQTLID